LIAAIAQARAVFGSQRYYRPSAAHERSRTTREVKQGASEGAEAPADLAQLSDRVELPASDTPKARCPAVPINGRPIGERISAARDTQSQSSR
jgi:hypothetical protein